MFCQRVRTSAPAGVAPERFEQDRLGGFVSGRVCVFLVKTESSTKASLRSRGSLIFRDRVRRSSRILASMRVVGSGEIVSIWIGRDGAC